jgi:sugar phosphate isomerase/epimerase
MKLAVSTATFFGKAFTEDAFSLIERLGVRYSEVFFATFSEYTPKFCDTLLQKKGGVKVCSVHSLTNQFEPDLFNKGVRARADAEKFFKQVLSSGKRLGAESYTFHGSIKLKNKKYDVDFGELGARYRELAAMAGRRGLKLALENVHWTFFNEPAFFAGLRPFAPELKTVLDIKQAMQSDIPYTAYLDVMEGTLANVHICDYDAQGRLCPPGRGIFDFKALFARLRAMGYEGTVVVELYGENFSELSELADSLRYLRGICDFTDDGG